jgi:hypothetical protein
MMKNTQIIKLLIKLGFPASYYFLPLPSPLPLPLLITLFS